MTGSTARRLLAVAAAVLVLAPLGVLSPAQAEAPALSTGCAAWHAAEGTTISSSTGSINVTGSFARGEQLRFTATAAAPSIKVTAPSGISTLTPASGQPARYDVLATSIHQFTITSGGGSVSLTIACGVPPKAVVTTPAEGATYGVNDVVTPAFSCVDGTNAATCTPATPTVDTSTTGAHTYVVVASDGSGLQTTTTVHYTVAKKPQTLHFTSEPVTGAKFNDRYGWAVTAESSSGLPVTLSTDEGSPVCQVSPFPPFIYGNVSGLHAGTCTIYANQAGNDEYLPAPQISTSFLLAREDTTLTAAKASKGVVGLSGTTFSASLHYIGWFGPGYGAEFPYPGQTVKFYVGGKLICSAVTVQKDDGTFFGGGVATCKAPIGVQAALKCNSYTAVYGGSQDYLPSTAVGKLQ